jgi:hypothetical protein
MDDDDIKVTFHPGKKFDIQLHAGLRAEQRLGAVFTHGRIETVELKTENWLWERTGNICIEYEWNGKPSGINATEATHWVHALERDGELLCYLMFTTDRLRSLVCNARLNGRTRVGGDDGLSKMALIRLTDLLK